MNAAHWVRARQEERELVYWLSLVAYEHHDHSFANRVYLLYLTLFFGSWVFAVLIFFAGGGAMLLQLIHPTDPVSAAVFLEVLLLGLWGIYGFWQALRRSPIVFSEQDETLLCQTPLNRRHVALRWLLMPWLKSALPFWLAAVALGFSVAEAALPGAMSASRIPEYAMYGLRAWLMIIPIHLALFSLQWAVGILHLQKDHERRWLAWTIMPVVIAFFAALSYFAFNPASPALHPWSDLPAALLFPFQTAFSGGRVSIAWLTSSLFALAALGLMYGVSGTLSLSRAVQETRQLETLHAAQRYGLSAYSANIQSRQRLGVMRKPTRLPAVLGAGSLVWKDVLQSLRALRLSSAFVWFQIFLLMLGMSFLTQPGSSALLVAFWVIQIGQVSVVRIRSDLACWPLVRQLPIPRKHFLLLELGPVCILALLVSLAGLAAGSIIFNKPLTPMVSLMPGTVAAVAGMAIFDVIRRSRGHLLLNESVPELSSGGILLGAIVAGVPILIQFLLPGPAGIALSILLSLGFALLAFNLAVHSFRSMDVPA